MIAGPMLGITRKKNQKMEPFPADGQKNINALSEVGRVMEQGANAPHGCSLIPVAHCPVTARAKLQSNPEDSQLAIYTDLISPFTIISIFFWSSLHMDRVFQGECSLSLLLLELIFEDEDIFLMSGNAQGFVMIGLKGDFCSDLMKWRC